MKLDPRLLSAAAALLAVALSPAPANAQCLAQKVVPTGSPSPSIGGEFGASMAMSGDTVFVGAPFDDFPSTNAGSIYRYRLTPIGAVQEDRWPGVGLGGAQVALNGSWGAYRTVQGNVQMVRKVSPANWQLDQIVTDTGWFGYPSSIAIADGPTPLMAIGAVGASNLYGRVYIYQYINDNWEFLLVKTQTTGTVNGHFGTNVAFAQSESGVSPTPIVLTGQPDRPLANGNSGRVVAIADLNCQNCGWIVYNWMDVPAGYANVENFGAHVGASLDQHRIVIASRQRVFVYARDVGGTGNFSFEEQLLPTVGGEITSVAISGNRILVASTGFQGAGTLFVFERFTNSFVQTDRIDNPEGGVMGAAVAIEGDLFAVTNPELGAGALYGGTFVGADCNANSTPDACDIFSGSSNDSNGNMIPDDCECGFTSYCTSNQHSGGKEALIAGSGPTSVSQNNFSLRVADAPANKPGIFFYGGGQINVPFGDGRRCVSAAGMGVHRVAPVAVTNSVGEVNFPVNFTLPPFDSGLGQITPFSTWNFQFWFRDPMGPGGSGYNLTNGVSVTFCP